ncbi:zinc metalloproteinase nas-7 [Nephila pilipes]|uniref:Metalloendopeptidase n=1 Tax=Nephila pilipes TaxID=299642 RepID=A0A8X6N366_NEPPI|nr:zinc metalloproteinase nas-7 [Nephila pilipes]
MGFRYPGYLCDIYTADKYLKEIPFDIHYSLDHSRRLIENAMAEIENYSRLVFIPRYDHKCYLRITGNYSGYTIEEDNGCYSIINLGYNGRRRFEVILHELMHAIGFSHEHMRPDRDRFVKIFWENIEPEFQSQYRKLTYNEYLWNDFEMDYESIMMYSSFAYSKNGFITMVTNNGAEIGINTKLSYSDKVKLTLL